MNRCATVAAALALAGPALAYDDGLTGATIHSNIHNALPWAHSAALTRPAAGHLRVNNGPGWTESTQTYNPGLALNNYELTSPGSCTTASSGGPSGTGADIADGTCHWKFVSGVDYVTATGWMSDNAPWTARIYTVSEFARVGTKIYTYYPDNPGCPGCGGQTTPSCASTVAPSGTTNSGPDRNFAAADGCKWHYQGDIVYSSNRSFIPTYTGARTIYNMTANYRGDLWNDREYLVGQNGEFAVFGSVGHNSLGDGVINGDWQPPCSSNCFRIIVGAAPGESFADRLTQYTPLTGYDPTQGVAIRNPLNSRFGTAILSPDSFVDHVGLQIKSDFVGAYDGLYIHSNWTSIQGCILEGSGSPFVVMMDAASVIVNSLIISHSTSGAFLPKYPGWVIHNTFVQPPGQAGLTATTGIASNGVLYGAPAEPVSNNAVFGFTHAASYNQATGQGTIFDTVGSSRNATDSPATDAGSVFIAALSATFTATPLPGGNNLYGVAPARAFVSWLPSGSDFRLRGDSPLRGAGAAFGTFAGARTSFAVDDLSLLRRHRPQGGRWDIGAW